MSSREFNTQLQTVEKLLRKQPLTMLQVALVTGILRTNICRYVSTLRKQDRIAIVRMGLCPISKHRAGFYTTNPDLFPKKVQAELFHEEG